MGLMIKLQILSSYKTFVITRKGKSEIPSITEQIFVESDSIQRNGWIR